MATVDEKVVRLTMDDSQFDKASDRTISKLDELKKSLEFGGAVDSFDELDKAASKVDMSPLEKGAEYVTQKFSALEMIAIGALTRIGSQAVDTGERMLKSLTIDNISDGWSKYADKTAAVQTIMSATAKQFTDTGVQMAFVEDKLERLNWFTDETSYRFLDMVNNIGKFTNNSVELGTAVTAMQGISTWAASAGANVTEAGRAMYNLSQAIAVGSVKLIDWKSIENANMATAEFKQMAIETAEELGTLKKVGEDTWQTLAGHDVTVETFSENLSYDKWFSSDVLLKVLDRYGGFADRLADVVSETGVLTTTLLGYIDDYVDGSIDMTEAVEETGLSAEQLNAILEELGDDQYELGRRAFKAAQETKTFAEAIDYVKEAVSSSWMQSFEYIFGNYEEAKALWSDLSEALYEVFVESGNVRNELLRLWKENGGRDRFIEAVKTALKNIMNLVDAVAEGFRRVFPETTLENLLIFTHRFELLVEALTPSEKLLNNISNIVELVVKVFQKFLAVSGAVIGGLDPILNLITGIFNMLLDLAGFASGEGSGILDRIFSSENLYKIYETVNAISNVVATIVKLLMLLGAGIFGEIITFAQNVYNTFQEGEGGISGFFQALIVNIQSAANSFVNGETVIGKVVKGIMALVQDLATNFMDAFSGGESKGLGGFIGNLASSIKDSGIFDVLEGLIELVSTAVLWLANGIAGLLEGGHSLSEVVAFVAVQLEFLWEWLKASISNLTVQDIAVVALVLSVVSLVSQAQKAIKSITTVISGLSGVLTSLQNTIASFAQGNWLNDIGKNLTNISKNTKYAQLALAIYLTVDGIMKLGEVPIDRLAYAVSALAVVFGLVYLAVQALDKFANAVGSATSGGAKNLARVGSALQGLGIAIGAISASIWVFSEIIGDDGNYGKLIVSLLSAVALMTAVVGVIAAFDKLKIDTANFMKIGPSLLIFATAIDALAIAVAILSAFNPMSVAVASGAVVALVGMMALLAAATKNADWASIAAASVTIISLSGSLIIMSGAVAMLSAAMMAFPGGIATAMIDLVGMIVLLTGAMALLGVASGAASATSLLAMSAAMIAFAGSITIMASALWILVAIPWDTMVKGAALLGAALLGFAAIAGMATLFAPGLAALAAVLVALAAAFISVGAAAWLIAEAAVKIGVLVAAIVAAQEVFGNDLPKKIGSAFDTLELVLQRFLEMVRNLAPQFALTFGALVVAAIEAIIFAIDAKYIAIIEAVMAIAVAILEVIARLGGPLVDALTRAIQGLTEGLPQLLDALGEFIEKLIEGAGVILNHALKGMLSGVLAIFGVELGDAGSQIKDNVLGGTMSTLQEMGYIVDNETGKIYKNIDGKLEEVRLTFNEKTGLIEEEFDNGLTNAANTSINDFNKTIDQKMDETGDKAKEFGKNTGDDVIEGYREGTGWGSPWSTILDSFDDLLETFQIGGANISDGVNTVGGSIGANFANAIRSASESNLAQYLSSDATNLATLTGYGAFSDLVIIDDFEGYTHRNLGMNPGSSAAARDVKAALEEAAQESGEDTANTWLESLTESMTSGLSTGSASGSKVASAAEEAVKEQSEVIKEAYEEGISEIELVAKRADLESNLWDAINKDAKEAELVAKNIAYTTKKISYQESRLNLALKQHQELVEAYGEESVEAQNAYFTVLEAQTDLVELQNSLVDLQNTYISNEQDLLDRMELVRNQRDLEYQLWQAQNPNATEAEQALKERENLSAQLEDATEDMILAQDNYSKAVERYGEGSNEAMQAWATYLQAVIEQTKLQNELTGAAQQSADDLAQNYKNASAWMRENTETINYLNREFGEERVQQYIRDTFGLQPLQQAEQELTQTAIESAEQVYTKYGMTMEYGLAALEPAFTQQGAAYTTNLTDGMLSDISMETVTEGVTTIVDTCLETANSEDAILGWFTTGEEIINGIIEGIKSKEGALYDYLEYVINQALAVIQMTAGVHSPSRETMWIAEMMGQGLVVGLTRYSPLVIGAAARLATDAIDAFEDSHTSSNVEFAGRLVAGGIAGAIDDYSYLVTNAAEGLLERTANEWENSNIINSKVLSMLETLGYAIEDLDYDFVMSLNMDKAYDELTDFERAVLDIQALTRRVQYYEGSKGYAGMTKEEFAAYTIGHNLTDEELDSAWRSYLDMRMSEYMDAVNDYMDASKLLTQTLAAMKGTSETSTSAVRETQKIEYVQNIYSEKPLSTLDIYRNTSNALSKIS